MAKKKKAEEEVLTEVESDDGDTRPSFRDDARSKIYAAREEQVAAEIGAEPEPTPEPVPEPTPEPTEAPQNGEAGPSGGANTNDAAASPVDPVQKHKLTINGQQAEYTTEELMQLASKGAGADQKFQEAAEMRKQAQEMMFPQQNSRGGPPPVNSQNQPPQIPDTVKSRLGDIANRLDFGTEEDRVQALIDAGAIFNEMKGSGQGPSPEQIVNVATGQALAVIEQRNEQSILMNEFQDILSDPPLAHATDIIAKQLAHKYASLEQPKTRLEILREAGNITKERYLRPVQASEQPNSPVPSATNVVPMGDKIERKRTAPQPPAAANAVANAVPKEQAVSPSSVVAAMRKQRGQA